MCPLRSGILQSDTQCRQSDTQCPEHSQAVWPLMVHCTLCCVVSLPSSLTPRHPIHSKAHAAASSSLHSPFGSFRTWVCMHVCHGQSCPTCASCGSTIHFWASFCSRMCHRITAMPLEMARSPTCQRQTPQPAQPVRSHRRAVQERSCQSQPRMTIMCLVQLTWLPSQRRRQSGRPRLSPTSPAS